MWPEPLRPRSAKLKATQTVPFSRSKLLEPALKWCLTGPGPPLSARRPPPPPSSTPEQALTAAARAPHPRATVAAGQLGPSANPTDHPPPKGRELHSAAPPRPHLPAPPVPSRPQRQQRQPRRSSQAHSGCAAAKKAPSHWPKRRRLPQQKRRRLALAAAQPPRRTRAMLTIRRRGAQPIIERVRIWGGGWRGRRAGGCARGAGGARGERVMRGGRGGGGRRLVPASLKRQRLPRVGEVGSNMVVGSWWLFRRCRPHSRKRAGIRPPVGRQGQAPAWAGDLPLFVLRRPGVP